MTGRCTVVSVVVVWVVAGGSFTTVVQAEREPSAAMIRQSKVVFICP